MEADHESNLVGRVQNTIGTQWQYVVLCVLEDHGHQVEDSEREFWDQEYNDDSNHN